MSHEKKDKKEDSRRGESLEGGERGARRSKGEVVSRDVHSQNSFVVFVRTLWFNRAHQHQ